jgi:hypothetical protein
MNYDDVSDYHSIKILRDRLAYLTRNFDLDDWRTARTPYYWESDKMPLILALQHKIKLLEYYINKGVPLK